MTMSTTWSYSVFSVMVWMYVLLHHAIDSCNTREYVWSILLPNTLSRTMIRSNDAWRGRKGYYTRGTLSSAKLSRRLTDGQRAILAREIEQPWPVVDLSNA